MRDCRVPSRVRRGLILHLVSLAQAKEETVLRLLLLLSLLFAKFDSDRFITSFLIQKCDSFTSLYVFTNSLTISALLCLCVNVVPCCIMLVYVLILGARNQRR